MSRFLFWSDLHLDAAPFEIPEFDASLGIDAILVAGDIDVKNRHVQFLIDVWEKWQVPIIAVAGNHEPYGSRWQKLVAQEREAISQANAAGIDIAVLRGAERVLGHTRIIGATLWTDLRLWPDDNPLYTQKKVQDRMNDYRAVKWVDDRLGIYRKMAPEDTLAMHLHEREYILGQLSEPHDGPTIVMTHHVPIAEVMTGGDRVMRQPITAAYYSDLWHLWRPHRIDAWIHGHAHDAGEIEMHGDQGPVRFINNIRGYPHETTRFDPLRVLEVGVHT